MNPLQSPHLMMREYSATLNNLALSIFVSESAGDGAVEFGTSHKHYYAELFVCIGGELIVETEQEKITIHDGDAVILPRDLRHKTAFSDTDAYVAIGILAARNDSVCEYDYYDSLSPLLCTAEPIVMRSAVALCASVVDISGREYPRRSPVPVIKLALALSELSDGLRETDTQITRHDKSVSGEKNEDRLVLINETVNVCYGAPYDPEEIAARLFITRRHLDRFVKEKYGKTLRDLIYAKRTDVACDLLINTDMSAEEVGRRVGFSSYTAFKGAFVSRYGLTPPKYRKNTKK